MCEPVSQVHTLLGRNALPACYRSVSEEVSDDKKGSKLWDLSMKLVGLA